MASCTDEVVETSPFLNGVEKTPIAVSLGINDGNSKIRSVTRAADAKFETGDLLFAYLRHVTTADPNGDPVVYSDVYDATTNNVAGIKPRIVGFKITEKTNYQNIADNYTNHETSSTIVTTDKNGLAAGLYWDDFSVGAKGDANDIRTENHALQSFYGYCYNGGSPSSNLVEAIGELGWTVPYDQTGDGVLKKADLLWSGTQTPVAYSHSTSSQISADHGLITIPYTHAMSMFTVELIARRGFATGALSNTIVEMQGMNRTCTATAPTKSITDRNKGTDTYAGKIKMYGATEGTSTTSEGTYPSRVFCAIAVPLTSLATDAQLLTLTNVDGNNYIVKVSSDMLNSWSSGLVSNQTQSGYNYKLTITLDKQTISVESTLANWVTLTATGNGEIQFPDDVDNNQNLAIEGDDGVAGSLQFTAEDLKRFSFGSSFDLYELISTNTAHANGDFGDRKTVSTYTDMATDPDVWVNSPEIYWPNSTDKYYFRAFAECTGETATNYTIASTGTTASLTASQGHDIVWGTTAAHDGYNGTTLKHQYQEGEAINPRTGEVPIAFRHIMSKISVNLATSEPANAGDPTPAEAVDLNGALISISKLATTGIVQLYAGSIQNGTVVDAPISDFCSRNYQVTGKTKLDNYIVIPQTITDDCKISITLSNGAVYSLKLNQCLASTSTAENPVYIDTWAPGRHYTYTINLTKEDITFRAMIKDWEEKVGSGNATLDWD